MSVDWDTRTLRANYNATPGCQRGAGFAIVRGCAGGDFVRRKTGVLARRKPFE